MHSQVAVVLESSYNMKNLALAFLQMRFIWSSNIFNHYWCPVTLDIFYFIYVFYICVIFSILYLCSTYIYMHIVLRTKHYMNIYLRFLSFCCN